MAAARQSGLLEFGGGVGRPPPPYLSPSGDAAAGVAPSSGGDNSFMPAARQASCADPGADAAGTDVSTITRPASSLSPWLAAESADPEAAKKSHFGDNPGNILRKFVMSLWPATHGT